MLVYRLFTDNFNLKSKVYNINPWTNPGHFTSEEMVNNNVSYGNTIEFAVPSPIPTHVFNNLPLLAENFYALKESLLAAAMPMQSYSNKLISSSSTRKG